MLLAAVAIVGIVVAGIGPYLFGSGMAPWNMDEDGTTIEVATNVTVNIPEIVNNVVTNVNQAADTAVNVPVAVQNMVINTTDTAASDIIAAPAPITGHDLAKWKEYMLDLINVERSAAGLDPVVLGDNSAAQAHADSMLAGCFASHWGMDGLKPDMRYSLAGGYQHNAENLSGLNYCIKPWENYMGLSLDRDIPDVITTFMGSPGHRANILDPHHAALNLGLAWDSHNIMVVQQFEYDYVMFDEMPTIQKSYLSFSGTAVNGAGFRSAEDLLVQVYYDPPPHNLTAGQLTRTYCYTPGYAVAALVAPLPPGHYYDERSYQHPTRICPDPYDVPAGASIPASPGEANDMWRQAYLASQSDTVASRTVPFLMAFEWTVLDDDFAVGADMSRILKQHGPGVYTVMVWGTVDGEAIPIATHSVFYETGR